MILIDRSNTIKKLYEKISFDKLLSDLLQGCSNKAVTITILQYCYNLVLSTLQHSCYIMTVSDLLEQSCNKSDNVIRLVTSC